MSYAGNAIARRPGPALVRRTVADFQHPVQLAAGGQGDLRLVIHRLLEQRLGERRVNADEALAGVELVGADNAVCEGIAVFVLEAHPGAEEHARGVRWRPLHDHDLVQALLQVTDAPVDLA